MPIFSFKTSKIRVMQSVYDVARRTAAYYVGTGLIDVFICFM